MSARFSEPNQPHSANSHHGCHLRFERRGMVAVADLLDGQQNTILHTSAAQQFIQRKDQSL